MEMQILALILRVTLATLQGTTVWGALVSKKTRLRASGNYLGSRHVGASHHSVAAAMMTLSRSRHLSCHGNLAPHVSRRDELVSAWKQTSPATAPEVTVAPAADICSGRSESRNPDPLRTYGKLLRERRRRVMIARPGSPST